MSSEVEDKHHQVRVLINFLVILTFWPLYYHSLKLNFHFN